MAIRLRRINGTVVALCAAATDFELGDKYIDDAEHEALSDKFMMDFGSMGFMDGIVVNNVRKELSDKIERPVWKCSLCRTINAANDEWCTGCGRK